MIDIVLIRIEVLDLYHTPARGHEQQVARVLHLHPDSYPWNQHLHRFMLHIQRVGKVHLQLVTGLLNQLVLLVSVIKNNIHKECRS